MKTLSFNINNYVEFKLTPTGQNIYEHTDASFPCNEYGYYKAQLHEVMRIFGIHLVMGCNTPIEGMVLLLDVKDLAQFS